jgi:hypothetical protein
MAVLVNRKTRSKCQGITGLWTVVQDQIDLAVA